jgi:hypothetical protein
MKKHVARRVWPAFSGGVLWVAGVGVQRALVAGWRRARDEEPPTLAGGAALSSAVAWAAASAAVSAAAAVLARHGAEVAWKQVTGGKPPKPK